MHFLQHNVAFAGLAQMGGFKNSALPGLGAQGGIALRRA
jgi:hypothetical protein